MKKSTPGERTVFRTSRSQMFFKMGVLKNFANSIRKRLGWSLSLIKLHTSRPATLLKRDFKTGIFLAKFFTEQLLVAASEIWPLFLEESGTKNGATVSNKYQILLKKLFAAAKIRASVANLLKVDNSWISLSF